MRNSFALLAVLFVPFMSPRLNIPELKMTDGPVGVHWGKATAFPSGISRKQATAAGCAEHRSKVDIYSC